MLFSHVHVVWCCPIPQRPLLGHAPLHDCATCLWCTRAAVCMYCCPICMRRGMQYALSAQANCKPLKQFPCHRTCIVYRRKVHAGTFNAPVFQETFKCPSFMQGICGVEQAVIKNLARDIPTLVPVQMWHAHMLACFVQPIHWWRGRL